MSLMSAKEARGRWTSGRLRTYGHGAFNAFAASSFRSPDPACLEACLKPLAFADGIVVLLDRCADGALPANRDGGPSWRRERSALRHSRIASSPPAIVQHYPASVFAFVAVLTPLSMHFGVRGFAPIIGLAGLFCLPLARPAGKDWIGGGILAALVVWAAVSARWSPTPFFRGASNIKDLERFTALHLALQMLLSGAFVFSAARLNAATAERCLTWLGWGLIAGVFALGVEMVAHAEIYIALTQLIGQTVPPDLAIRNLAQAGDVVAMMAWPVGLALVRRGWKSAGLALAAYVPLSFVVWRGFAPSLALVISVPVFFLVLRVGARALYGLMGLAVTYVLFTPWVMLALQKFGLFAALSAHLPPSWSARLEIWTMVTDRMIIHPLRGAGLDASRVLPGGILHPHDVPLQLWFELGAPGALLGAAFWGWLFYRLAIRAEKERLFAATAAATATVYLSISAVGFGLWQEWWLCVGALGLAMCLAFGKSVMDDAAQPSGTA
jgi:hypothetical protein